MNDFERTICAEDEKMNNFEAFLFGLGLKEPYMPGKYEEEIFHYTSPNAFESILFKDREKVTLWASRYDCLNDISEGTIAIKIYRETCEDLLKLKKITKEQYDGIANLKASKKELVSYEKYNNEDVVTKENVQCQKYICCFSKNQDSLAMWNYYSKGNKYEGYNIVFYSKEVKEAFNSFYGTGIRENICPVIYDKKEQQELIEKFLIDILKYYFEENKETIKSSISTQLNYWSLIFKSEYFKHEEEVRVIISIPKDTLEEDNKFTGSRQLLYRSLNFKSKFFNCKKKVRAEMTIPKDSLEDEKNSSSLDIKYRNSYGYIIPYIELTFEKNCVSDVCIGPLQYSNEQKETQKEISEERLKANGYTNVETTYSKIPIRY